MTIHQHRKYLPYVFTEHGTIMLANVLNSPTSVHASLQVVMAFVQLRHIFSTHKELAHKLIELERKIENHDEEIHKWKPRPRCQCFQMSIGKSGPTE
jgi:phage regulator Rha-like protein